MPQQHLYQITSPGHVLVGEPGEPLIRQRVKFLADVVLGESEHHGDAASRYPARAIPEDTEHSTANRRPVRGRVTGGTDGDRPGPAERLRSTRRR